MQRRFVLRFKQCAYQIRPNRFCFIARAGASPRLLLLFMGDTVTDAQLDTYDCNVCLCTACDPVVTMCALAASLACNSWPVKQLACLYTRSEAYQPERNISVSMP